MKLRKAVSLVLIVAGIGVGIGAGIGGGYVSGSAESGENWPILLLGGVGAGLGAFTGYLIGRGKQKELIYEVK